MVKLVQTPQLVVPGSEDSLYLRIQKRPFHGQVLFNHCHKSVGPDCTFQVLVIGGQ